MMSVMANYVNVKTCVVVPNWNGRNELPACLDSLLAQTEPARVIVVENGSTDGSLELLQQQYPQVELVVNQKNLGFAGGVNSGIRHAMELGAAYVALFNNDAVADQGWLKELVGCLDTHKAAGIATGKLLNANGAHLDSTGDFYTVWGLPYPRGRGEPDNGQYDDQTQVFAASGGASLYRVSMLKRVGLFDEDFFAYYEDVDISFRAQLYGWKVAYVPSARAYHATGSTSSKIKGFTTYQTLKNHPLLLWKNVPWRLMPRIWPRLVLAYSLFVARALSRGQFAPVAKGLFMGSVLWPKKLLERRRIQKARTVHDEYIWNMLVHDLPPNAHALHRLRAAWWKLRGRHE